MDEAPLQQGWDRWFRWLPFVVLGLATTVVLATAPWAPWSTPAWRLQGALVALVATACLLFWWTFLVPAGAEGRRWGARYYAARTALALTLTVLNPLFCIFAWIGFIDADQHLRGRAVVGGLGVTALIMALGQSGGLPFGGTGHVALFGLLVLVNFGLAHTMGRWGAQLAETSEQRANAITDLERVNAELERTLAENAALHETVVQQARTAGVQEERERLAREIHDGIAQSLAGVLAQLQAAQEEAARGSVDPLDRVGRAAELARDALTEARRSMLDLSPAPLSALDLPDAVGRVVTVWNADNEGVADVVVTGQTRPVHPEVEATVLRVTQESLSNVARHAAATRVGVTLTYDDAEVMLDVRDDGVGFAVDQPRRTTSFGLRGMEQRADRLAGALAIESAPGGGTAVSLRLPAVVEGAA